MRHIITYLLLAVTAAAAPSVAPNGLIVSNGLSVVGGLTVNGTSIVVAASAAVTNGGATINGQAISNGAAFVVAANAVTNGGATIDGQALTNGAAITTASGGSLSTNGGTMAGALVSTAKITITNAASGTGFWLYGANSGDIAFMGIASPGPSMFLYRSNGSVGVLSVATNAGAFGRLSRYKAGVYYELVDSETFTPSSYISTTNWQATVTNFLRFLTTTAAPTNYLADGSRGEIRTDSTNLYLHNGVNWGRFPGNWGPW